MDGPDESGSEEPASGGMVIASRCASEQTGESVRCPKITSGNPESKLNVPTEGSFPNPPKYIDVARTTDTTSDVTPEKHVEDYRNVGGDRELSDTWIGFTRVTFLSEKPPDGYAWSGWRLTRKQTTSRPVKLWTEMWKHMSDASKRKEKQKVGYRESKAR